MPESVLPGVYIEVRAEGLIRPGIISTNNIGIVGTAAKGPLGEPITLGSYTEAREIFGDYDMWNKGESNELTLVRALEIAFKHGAYSVTAVRVAKKDEAKAASLELGTVVKLEAKTPGTWGNKLKVNVQPATDNAFVEDKEVDAPQPSGGTQVSLGVSPLVASALNRVEIIGGSGPLKVLFFDADVASAATPPIPKPVPAPGEVLIEKTGDLTFGEALASTDKIRISYAVGSASAKLVTVKYGEVTEEFTVASGNDLITDIERDSNLLTALVLADPASLPPNSDSSTPPTGEVFQSFTGGTNGEADADYTEGLNLLLNEDVHIMLAAGQDNETMGSDLIAHCVQASTDLLKHERIAVVGSKLNAKFEDLTSHTLASDRCIFVGPGIRVKDNAPERPATLPEWVILPGAYAAAAVAGMLAARDPETSLTNKTLSIDGLETVFTPPQLEQLVKARVLALELRKDYRVVKGITTATNRAWTQITTRRIVDYAKYGTRDAASSFIGLLNNERVRGALKASVESLLIDMVLQEMLTKYELEVSATRDDEIRGIARVIMNLSPTFSIDQIRVTMYLQ